MYRSVPKDFIIPFRFMREDEKDLFDYRSDDNKEQSVNIEEIETAAKKLIDAALSASFSTLSKLNRAQLLDIVSAVTQEFLKFHLDYIKCLKKISKNGFNGMSINQILNMHLGTVRDIFNFHYNGFSCGKYIAKGLSSDVFSEFKSGLLDEVNGLLEKLGGVAGNLTREQLEKIDIAIISAVFNWLVENVPCFSEVSKEKAVEKLAAHINKFKEVFADHLIDLGCK